MISSFRSETALYPPLYFLQCLAQSFTVDLQGYLWVRLMSISTRQQTNVMTDWFLLRSVPPTSTPCSVHMPQAFSLPGPCALICVCNHAVLLLGMSSQLIPLVKLIHSAKSREKIAFSLNFACPLTAQQKPPFLSSWDLWSPYPAYCILLPAGHCVCWPARFSRAEAVAYLTWTPQHSKWHRAGGQ